MDLLFRGGSNFLVLFVVFFGLTEANVNAQAFLEAWKATFNGSGNWHDDANAVTVDREGNVYVAATASNTSGHDIVTIKYDPSGNQLWASNYDGSAQGGDAPVAIAVDEEGSVLVTGYSKGESSDADIVTLKYHSNGTLE